MNGVEHPAADTSGSEPQASEAPRGAPDGAPVPDASLRFNLVESTLRLAVGSALIGRDELVRRLQIWEQQTQAEDRAVAGQPASDEDRVRYALIGFLFLAQHRAGRRLNQVVNQYQRHNPARELSRTLDRATGNRVLRRLVTPLRSQVDGLARRWGEDVEHWVRVGRIGERDSRSLANKATGELIDEVIAYLAQNPAVADAVQQQGVGMAGDAIDTVRQSTSKADDAVERVVWRILGRPPRLASGTVPPAATESLPKDAMTHE